MASSVQPITLLLGTQEAAGTALAGVTTGTGRWVSLLGGPQNITVTFSSIGTTSGGTVLIEETDDPNDGLGLTASQLVSQAASGFTGSVKLCTHIAIGAGMWIRARVSSTITGGGTIVVTLCGS